MLTIERQTIPTPIHRKASSRSKLNRPRVGMMKLSVGCAVGCVDVHGWYECVFERVRRVMTGWAGVRGEWGGGGGTGGAVVRQGRKTS